MNYKGIVNWLQEDGFVLMGFSDKGEVTLMEKHTGKDVNDLSAFLIATVLPIAKKKVVYLEKDKVEFVEVHLPSGTISAFIYGGEERLISEGEGETGEYAMVNAIENYIKNKERMNDKR
jgi:hypothetical protein